MEKTIDVTPTWSGILPALIALLESGKVEAIKTAETELRRMAELADKYVEGQKNVKS